jgi:hypothetical protein
MNGSIITVNAEFVHKVSSITVNPGSAELVPGGTAILTAQVFPADAYDRLLNWESSNPSVASIFVNPLNNKSVTVTAISAGTANITARAIDGSNVTCTAVITVMGTGNSIVINFTNEFSDEFIDLTYGSQTISKSRYEQLTVTVPNPEAYDTPSAEWYFDNTQRSSGSSYTEYSSNPSISIGPHTVTAVLIKDGVPYSKTVKFQVVK